MRRIATLLLPITALFALDAGDRAPGLDGITWLQGERFAPTGAISVVEFWATWCPPCRTSIPHLAKLQEQYPAVRFVGISDEDEATVRGFMKETPAMSYRVAIASEEQKQAWMANDNGIPHAFIVDAQGMVLWEGLPMQMDAWLAQVVAGTFDAAAARAAGADMAALKEALQGEQPDLAAAKRIIARMRQRDPLDAQALQIGLAIAKHEDDAAGSRAILAGLPLDRIGAEQANELAWEIATADKLPHRHLDLALRLIDRAVAAEPANAAYIDTRARVLFCLGLVEQAVAEQERAITLKPDDDDMAQALEHYQQVLAWRKDVAGGKTPAQPVTPKPRANDTKTEMP